MLPADRPKVRTGARYMQQARADGTKECYGSERDQFESRVKCWWKPARCICCSQMRKLLAVDTSPNSETNTITDERYEAH